MIREGSKVSYVGEDSLLAVGDVGKVIASVGEGSHVLWATGACTGEIILVPDMDLVTGVKTVVTETIWDGPLVTVAVRDTFDMGGNAALLNALNEEGHLAAFSTFAEEALASVAAKIHTDPSMREALSHLEPEEQDEFISFAAAVLLRDAFGDGDED